MPKVVALIQARLGSSRFPRKVLEEINGKAMWRWVVDACIEADLFPALCVPKSEHKGWVDLVGDTGCTVVAGHDTDCLDRLFAAADMDRSFFDATHFMRLTADSPLHCSGVLRHAADIAETGEWDVVQNMFPPTWCEGLDIEIYSYEALKRMHEESTEDYDREHLTWARRNPGSFSIYSLECPDPGLKDWRLSVDTPEDLAKIRAITTTLPQSHTWDELAKELAKHDPYNPPNRVASPAFAAKPPGGPEHSSECERLAGGSLIPGMACTSSKRPTHPKFGLGKYQARGSHIPLEEHDGEYIDWPMGLGCTPLGYGHPAIEEALEDRIAHGVCTTLHNPDIDKLAEMVLERVAPKRKKIGNTVEVNAEGVYVSGKGVVYDNGQGLATLEPHEDWQVSFFNDGSGACEAAVRLARHKLTAGYMFEPVIQRYRDPSTGVNHYHGWHEWATWIADGDTLGYGELPAGRRKIVILEPARPGMYDPEFLKELRSWCDKTGSILIFDETITGFRLSRGGVVALSGVAPDLLIVGKALSNGLPMAALCGRRDLMESLDGEVHCSGTTFEDRISTAAAIATLEALDDEDYWSSTEGPGTELLDGLQRMVTIHGLADHFRVVGWPQWVQLQWGDESVGKLLHQELQSRGIISNGHFFTSLAHDEEAVHKTLVAYREAFSVVKMAIELRCVEELLWE